MNITKLKEAKLRKKIHKLSTKLNKERLVSKKEIRSVGILTTDEVSSKIDISAEIESILELRNSKIYSFKKFNKLDNTSFKHFTEKDINWKGEFIQQNFQSFLEQPFDLLIGYFNTNNLYLELAVLQSKASFKVGFAEVNSILYDIEFSEQLNNIKEFSLELKKYLQILKKLKN